MKPRLLLVAAAVLAVAAIIARRPAPLALGQKAPPLRLAGLAGEAVSLDTYKGKVVLLTFWATWCHTCTAEMPAFEQMYQKYRAKGFEVLAPSVDIQGRKAVLPYLASRPLSFPVLLADPLTARTFGVGGLPTTYLIDSQGTLSKRYVGPIALKQLETDILETLNRRAS